MKRALVTGANKSIGFETVRQLLRKGYYVYLGSRDVANGQQAIEKLAVEGLDNVEVIQIDISNKHSIAEAAKVVAAKTDVLDLLINNAGILGKLPQQPSSVAVQDIRTVFDTNFFGTINVVQHFMNLLSASENPVITNITSGLGSLTLHSDPSWKYYAYKGAAYGPSKTALNAYTVALAYELKDKGFKVNAIDPGHTATDFNRHQGTGSVEDAAAFVVKYSVLDADGPTGKFFSKDADGSNESPW
ncbi:MAG: SDR family NAD(P)-dependent oxidoreductase, partial [Flavipsychrobacter sp.]